MHDKLVIKGNRPLYGDVKISGAKNAVLPLISISLLINKGYVLNNVPNLFDTNTMLKLINELGIKTKFSNGKWWISWALEKNRKIKTFITSR